MGVLLVATLSKLQSQKSVFGFIPHRFVITRPANECHLLPSDLVFCAIPFSITCDKSESNASIQDQDTTTKVISMSQGSNFQRAQSALNEHSLSPANAMGEKKSPQLLNSRVYPLNLFDASDIDPGK